MNREVLDMAVSVAVLSLAFSKFFPDPLSSVFAVTAVFAFHELAHRSVARFYGCFAEYRRWDFGLLLAAVTAAVPSPFVFAAPGAVVISAPFGRRLGKKQFGVIALSGPLSNIAVGAGFLALFSLFPSGFFLHAAGVSFFLAFFNLIPVRPLDGGAVFSWSRAVWAAVTGISFLGYLLI